MTQQLKIEYVPVGALEPNPWNTNRITDPANEERLRESLRRLGAFKPILVRSLPSGMLQILGGEHRWKAAIQLGMPTVPVINLGLIDDRRAKEVGLVDNGRYGEDDTMGLAGLLKELGDDVLTFMPYSEAELSALSAAASISLDDLDKIDRDQLPDLQDIRPAPTAQILRFKIPVEDTAWVSKLVDDEVKVQNFKDEDSLTNAGHALISLLKRARES